MAKPFYGFKFLRPNMQSQHSDSFFYPAPTPIFDESGVKVVSWKPTPWITVNIPEKEKNGEPCGVGLHLMKDLVPRWFPYMGVCYMAEGRGLLGEDDQKARFCSIRLLMPVAKNEIFYCSANLSYANLSYANLRYADLSSVDLRYADLSYANLRSAKYNKYTIGLTAEQKQTMTEIHE